MVLKQEILSVVLNAWTEVQHAFIIPKLLHSVVGL